MGKIWGKGTQSGKSWSVAVLKCCGAAVGKRIEVGGRNIKCQSSKYGHGHGHGKRALSANGLKICSRAVSHIPGANIKEFLVTILCEAKRAQTRVFEPERRVLGLQ